MKRTTTRIIAMMCLYNYDLTKSTDFASLIEVIMEENVEYDKEFLDKIIACVMDNLSDIDYEIAKCIDNYSIDRLSYVDRNIIRVAIAEMKYLSTPPEVAINEAVDISKEYSETSSLLTSKFNNALLDKIKKDLNL